MLAIDLNCFFVGVKFCSRIIMGIIFAVLWCFFCYFVICLSFSPHWVTPFPAFYSFAMQKNETHRFLSFFTLILIFFYSTRKSAHQGNSKSNLISEVTPFPAFCPCAMKKTKPAGFVFSLFLVFALFLVFMLFPSFLLFPLFPFFLMLALFVRLLCRFRFLCHLCCFRCLRFYVISYRFFARTAL